MYDTENVFFCAFIFSELHLETPYQIQWLLSLTKTNTIHKYFHNLK